jgi:transposase-like protein
VTQLLRGLIVRGLMGVQLAVSDARPGLNNALVTVLGARWQRCAVRFVRNMHGRYRAARHGLVSAALREVFNATDRAETGRSV